MKVKKITMVLISIILVSVLLSGCASPSGTGEESQAKTEIITGEEFDIKSLDPHATNDIPSTKALAHIYSNLLVVNSDSVIVGDLAEKWEQISDTEWAFKLVEGVKFHDGTELKASDVKFSIERQKNSARVKHIVEKVKEIKIQDDYNFTIVLKEPYAPLLAALCQPGSCILSEKAVTAAGDDYANQPVGTGPMKYVDWIPGDRLILERFDDYFKSPCKVEKLVMRVIPEGTTRLISLETGEIDLAADVAPTEVARLKENPELEFKQRPAITMDYIGFNLTVEPFDNILVRQAINHAIDKEALVDAVLEGAGKTAKTVVGYGIQGYYDGMEGFEYDIEKAKELLAQAGYPDGFSTRICTSGEARNRACQLVQADLAKIGIELEIDLYEWAAFLDTVNNGDMSMFMNAWVNTSLDPDGSLTPLFHSKNHGATGNRMIYTNPDVDALLEAGEKESDPDKRMEIYKEAQEIIVNDCPWVPTYNKILTTGLQKGLKGLELHPTGANRYENLYYE